VGCADKREVPRGLSYLLTDSPLRFATTLISCFFSPNPTRLAALATLPFQGRDMPPMAENKMAGACNLAVVPVESLTVIRSPSILSTKNERSPN
jgi:hypothetical protein